MERHSKQVAPIAYGVIAARLASSRLPNKILGRLGGKTLLEYQYERIVASKTLKRVHIIVPEKDILPIEKACVELPLKGGNEFDVLDRFEKCYEYWEPLRDTDVLVKFTADSPLIDARHIDNIVKRFLQDDASFGFLKGFPKGMYFNMCRVGALRDLVKKISVEDRAIWNQLNETWVWFKYGFTIRCYEAPYDFSDINLEVNDRYDMERVRSIVIGEGDI